MTETTGQQSIAFYITGTSRFSLDTIFESLEELKIVESYYKLYSGGPTMAKVQMFSFVVLVTSPEDTSSKSLEEEIREGLGQLVNIDKLSWSRLAHPIKRV